MRLSKLLAIMILLLSTSTPLMAQSKEEKARAEVVKASTRFRTDAGLVNFVQGDVRCTCTGHGGARAENEPALVDGDALQTGEGRVEVLLSPGYYLRLSRNSEARFLDLSNGNLKVKLLKGSAIIEIPMNTDSVSWYDSEFRDLIFDTVTVITPSDEYAVTRAGAYRFDVVANTESRVRVLKGVVVVAGVKLKDGYAARLIAGSAEVSSGEKLPGDEFDEWSRGRALKLVQANQSLKNTEWYKLMRNGRMLSPTGNDEPVDINRRTISALTGGVTYVEKAFVRQEGEKWQELKSGGRLTDGEHVLTDEDCRAEIAPYPYFYLFLRGGTEMVYSESKEGNVAIKVLKGSVIVLVNEPRGKMKERNILKLIANRTEYEIERTGYYRLDSLDANRAAMLVYEGTLHVGGKEIGSSKQVLTTADTITQSSFDKDAKDSFNVWIQHRMLRGIPARIRNVWFAGAWFLNPETNEYTFVPGDRHCKSPYGGDYSAMYRVHAPVMIRTPQSRDPSSGPRRVSPVRL